MDPDEGMLAEAERQAGCRGVTNARWVAARAEDLPAGLGKFRVVVFAQSFHWTDRDRVATTVLELLEPGGAFVHISDLKDRPAEPTPLPLPAPPYARIGDLVRRYLGPVRRAGQGTLVNGTPNREDLVLARAGFENFQRHVVPAGEMVGRSADDVVAWAFSRSDSAPHLFGDRLEDFERDLRAVLVEPQPGPEAAGAAVVPGDGQALRADRDPCGADLGATPNGAIGSSAATPGALPSSIAAVRRAMLAMEARMPPAGPSPSPVHGCRGRPRRLLPGSAPGRSWSAVPGA